MGLTKNIHENDIRSANSVNRKTRRNNNLELSNDT